MSDQLQDLKELELRCYPKVEFLALKPEIDDLLSKGYSAKGIFRKLSKDNKIMMSYTSLSRYIRSSCKNEPNNKKINTITPINAEINKTKSTDAQSLGVSNKSQIHNHDAKKYEEDIFGD